MYIDCIANAFSKQKLLLSLVEGQRFSGSIALAVIAWGRCACCFFPFPKIPALLCTSMLGRPPGYILPYLCLWLRHCSGCGDHGMLLN